MSDRNDRNELEAEQNRRSRVVDLLEERKHDKARAVKKAKFSHPLVELNIRISLYVQQFGVLSLEQLIIQTLLDFNREITVLQNNVKTLTYKKPVAEWNPKERPDLKELIYIDPNITKEDFKSGKAELFTNKEPLK